MVAAVAVAILAQTTLDFLTTRLADTAALLTLAAQSLVAVTMTMTRCRLQLQRHQRQSSQAK
jgi:hypothetical protein